MPARYFGFSVMNFHPWNRLSVFSLITFLKLNVLEIGSTENGTVREAEKLWAIGKQWYLCNALQIGEVLKLPICPTPSDKFKTPAKTLPPKLSFSHICEIMTQDNPLARFFYETECIKGTWSVKELRRQISTNLYFRSGVSKDPQRLLSTIKSETNTPVLTIRQPSTFEFLGLNANYPTRQR